MTKLPVITTQIQTRYSDTDALGHISSGSYITYMEVGRLDYFTYLEDQLGYKDTSVVANINLDYHQECFYGDAIRVVTWCSRVGTKSITLNAEIWANDNLAASGSSANVAFDPVARKSTTLPEGWVASDYPKKP